MRTRIIKSFEGATYVRAASVNNKSLWLNPNKTTARRKTLKDLWKN